MAEPISLDELQKTVDLYHSLGENKTKTGKALGINRSSVMRRLERAALKGIAPGHFNNGVAPGYLMGKVTVHRDAEGNIKNTWERQHPDQELALEALIAAADAVIKNVAPRKPLKPPKLVEADLLTQYTFTDYHLNMLAWHKEGGANWDLKIAEMTGVAAMEYLTTGSPRSDTGVVLIQGDWQHSDSLKSETPTSGHALDSDSRPGRAIEVSMRLIETLVTLALQKHKNVILLICEGNHDLYTSLLLRKMFKRLYKNEPRVSVPDSELPFYALEWGKVALFYHHGHMKKWKDLPLMFAAMFPKIWGKAVKRYGNTGHYHHEKREEFSGIKMIQHPTMAANDSHGSRQGYISEREMTAITFHKEYGRGSEVVVTPEMIGMSHTS